MDRTDEIRAVVVTARRRGWAVQLDYAIDLLRIPDPDLAQAVLIGLRREIAP